MNKFDYFFNMYNEGNEAIYDELTLETIKELEAECEKYAKYYDFGCFLNNVKQYYE